MSQVIPVYSKIPQLIKELSIILPNYTFHNVKVPESDKYFKDSPILICDFDLISTHLYKINAKWVQGTWAGVEPIINAIKEPINYKITRFTGEYFGYIMGEYVVSNIINIERNFLFIRENQSKNKWDQSGNIKDYRTIYDLTIGILGVGNIGERIGKLLNFMGSTVVGFGKTPKEKLEKNIDFLKEYFQGKENLTDFLKLCDYIVNVLPNTKETQHLLNNDVLKNCKANAVFINIGRGSIISEDSLIKALNNQWISAAVLDVFEEEPLRSTSALWKMPQVFITPHVAGTSRNKDIAQQFKKNLNLFQSNLHIPGTIDFNKGY